MLAAKGCVVLTGGYGGAMEAVCRGAAESGGEAEGVVCRAFSGKTPNPFLTRVVWTDDLLARTRTLVEGADAYVALDPRTGTLAEVTSVWALFKAGHLDARPLVLVGDDWKRLHSTLLETGIVERNLLEWSVCVSGPRQVLAAIEGTADRESPPNG
jgi:predicted Rossmann-fold nucleotide-binding protein